MRGSPGVLDTLTGDLTHSLDSTKEGLPCSLQHRKSGYLSLALNCFTASATKDESAQRQDG